MQDFEKSFGDFIDQKEYDQAEDALFTIVRASYRAGWLAAGGSKPKPQKDFNLVRSNKVIPLTVYADSAD